MNPNDTSFFVHEEKLTEWLKSRGYTIEYRKK
jgi:hypothetical protein